MDTLKARFAGDQQAQADRAAGKSKPATSIGASASSGQDVSALQTAVTAQVLLPFSFLFTIFVVINRVFSLQ